MKNLDLKCVPIINDSAHLHLTLADWESLKFTHIAVDAINLLIKSNVLIPESAETLFFDTRVRTCHKVTRSHVLSSPFDGQKIEITQEKLKALFQKFSEKYPHKKIIWVDENNASTVLLIEGENNKHYVITEQPGQDAEKGIFYEISNNENSKTCPCYCCQNFTREYLEHLDHVAVPLGMRMRILHNLSCN